MVQLSISVPPELQHWLDGRVAAEGYSNAAEYVRELIQRDQDDYDADVRRVRRFIQEGIDSGIVDMEPEDVLKEIMASTPRTHG